MSRINNDSKIIKEIFRGLALLLREGIRILWAEGKNLYYRLIEKLRFSLTFKITWVYANKTFGILFFLGLLITFGFTVFNGWSAQERMKRDLNLVKDYLASETGVGKDMIKRLSELDNLSISLFDGEGKVLYTTEDDGKSAVYYRDGWELDKLNDNFMLVTDDKPRGFKLSSALKNGEGSLGYAMVISEVVQWNNQEAHLQLTSRLAREAASVIVLGLALTAIDALMIFSVVSSGARSSRRILKPIEVMTRTVENITINELDTRLDVRGSQDELKDLAKTFNKMLDRLQQSYEQQNQFVSDASHELRTPISVIQGYAGLLDRWGKNDEQVLEEAISAIKSESESMKDLVEKLLFLARSDKNTQRVEKSEFQLNELVEELVKETRMIDSDHEIRNYLNDEIKINADRRLLKEALRVFIDNSIKYTPKGGNIKIDSLLSEKEIEISIEDTGVGISKEDLPHIFNRFYRADKARTRVTGGTGLGLSIAKWIIEKHDGRINVQSEVNVGTRISISLPRI